MIEKIFTFESTCKRQREAPLFEEREQYLSQMLDQGNSRMRLRSVGAMLLHVVRVMELTSLRTVDVAEVREAGRRWVADATTPNPRRGGRQKTDETFTFVAMKWLRFHKQLVVPTKLAGPNEIIVFQYVQFLEATLQLSRSTIRGYGSRALLFLKWVQDRHKSLSIISSIDVEDFLTTKRNEGCLPRTIASFCVALRKFFLYAQIQKWNKSNIAKTIFGPKIPRHQTAPKGPKWKDVRRLIDSVVGSDPASLRAAAIISLCAIYAMRSSEIVALKLNDFDWVGETFTIKRSKNGRIQQFPIQFEVGETILRYLRQGRPRSSFRNLFISLCPPYRPMESSTLWTVVAKRMKGLGIDSENCGTHSLRHSCATQLLRSGSSLKDIADFLGHRDMTSVSIYAKYDIHTLREVAAFSLAGVK